ncbi:AraC family transcriptional regulator, partial [Acinetobacter baumannii]
KLFQLLQTESNDNQESRFSIIEGLLKALLAKILEVAQPFMNKKIAKPNLYNAYRELLSQSSEIKNSVAHYAAMLNTTPQNLNMVCRKVVD